jgi:cephalosporin-C deacetylase
MDSEIEENAERSGRDFDTFGVSLRGFGGITIRCWYSVPRDRPSNRGLPAVIATPGYDGVKDIPLHIVATGYAVLTLFPRGQGESERDWTVDQGTTKFTHGAPDPEKYYYRGAYLDCIRGVDFLCSQPEIDDHRIGMWGRSQGGTFGLTTASLDSRVAAVVAEEPFLSDFPVAIHEGGGAYEELREYLAEHPNDEEELLSMLQYFDVLTHADAVVCPTLINLGQKDIECPASTIRQVFQTLRCPKALIEYPNLGHEPCTDFNVHAMDWLHRYLG